MLTPQDVASRAFPKAVMGGYNMASVDEFLDELSDDYSALYKENAALKSKMKVLVDKVEDYRATEDSMRATLLTAQKMADSIVKEAEAKRDTMLAEARAAAQAQMGELDRQRREAEERLAQGKRDLADFIATARSACEKELEFLSRLDGMAVTPEPPKAEDQTGAAARNNDVEIVVKLHQCSCTLTGGVLHKIDASLRQSCRIAGVLHDLYDCHVGVQRLLAAAQNDGVAGFDTKTGSVGGDVGACLVDDADNAQRHTNLADFQAVGAFGLMEHLTDRIGERGNLFDALRHGINPLRG